MKTNGRWTRESQLTDIFYGVQAKYKQTLYKGVLGTPIPKCGVTGGCCSIRNIGIDQPILIKVNKPQHLKAVFRCVCDLELTAWRL